MLSAAGRLRQDLENIAEMAIDDIEAALWHLGNNKEHAMGSLDSAIGNLQEAMKLLKEVKF